MNREFLKFAATEEFIKFPAEAVKIYTILVADAVTQSSPLVRKAAKEGLILSTKSRNELMETCNVSFLTFQRHLVTLKKVGLVKDYVYSTIPAFQLGVIKEGRAVWFEHEKTAVEKSPPEVTEPPKTSVKEAIQLIQQRRKEAQEFKEKLQTAVVKKRPVGEFVPSQKQMEKTLSAKVLEAYTEGFKRVYGGLPTEFRFNRGVPKYPQKARMQAKNWVRFCGSELDAIETIDFVMDNLEKVMEHFKYTHPVNYAMILLKAVAKKAQVWKEHGFPVYNEGKVKKRDPVGHRYNPEADWDIPEHLQ